MRWWAVIAAALVVVGCDGAEMTADGTGDDDGEGMGLPLVEPKAWEEAAEEVDVFASMRPDEVDCDPLRGISVEETAGSTRLEINTAWCNYATLEQPIVADLEPGDTVEVRVWHFELTGEPAQAYLGVALDGAIAWESTVPIPSESALVKDTFEVTEALPAGTPVQFHVHNHGLNTWELVSISRL